MWISKKKLAQEKHAEFVRAADQHDEFRQWDDIEKLKRGLKKLKKDLAVINLQLAELKRYLEG